METERSYLQRRAEEEHKAASEAADPKAREAHETLAAHYEQQLSAGGSGGLERPTSAQDQASPSALN